MAVSRRRIISEVRRIWSLIFPIKRSLRFCRLAQVRSPAVQLRNGLAMPCTEFQASWTLEVAVKPLAHSNVSFQFEEKRRVIRSRSSSAEGREVRIWPCSFPIHRGEYPVQAFKRWMFSLIRPRISTPGQMQFFEIQIREQVTEVIHGSSMQTSIAFVLRIHDRVEIPHNS